MQPFTISDCPGSGQAVKYLIIRNFNSFMSVQMNLTDEKHDEKANVVTKQKTCSFWNNI